MTTCLAGLAQRALGDVLALLDGKQTRGAFGETPLLACRWVVVWSGGLDVEPSVFNCELDGLLG